MPLGTHCNSFSPHPISPRVVQDWQTWSAQHQSSSSGGPWTLADSARTLLPACSWLFPCQQQHGQGKLPGFGTALVPAEIGSLCLTVSLFAIAAEHRRGMEKRLTLSNGLPHVCITFTDPNFPRLYPERKASDSCPSDAGPLASSHF